MLSLVMFGMTCPVSGVVAPCSMFDAAFSKKWNFAVWEKCDLAPFNQAIHKPGGRSAHPRIRQCSKSFLSYDCYSECLQKVGDSVTYGRKNLDRFSEQQGKAISFISQEVAI
jgi:hypothetical protein